MIKTILNYIAEAKAWVIDKFTTDTAELITELSKLEAKIERSIAKDLKKAEKLSEAAKALNEALLQKDRNLNAAYKLLHNVTELTK